MASRNPKADWMKMVCEKCGEPQKPDQTQSTSHWNVFPVVPCPKCGGRFVPKMLRRFGK